MELGVPGGLELNNVSVSFNSVRALDGVSLQVKPRRIVGLIGPTGAGKSVLLKTIAGLLPIETGSIAGVPSSGGGEETCSLMFQEGALFDSLTVFDNISFPLVGGNVPVSRLPKEEASYVNGQVVTILRRVGLDWAANKMPNELSGGMRRRVSLARALVTAPRLGLLDDPTSGLDPIASGIILDLITELRDELGSTMFIVSHDLRRLLPRCCEIIALFGGKVRYQGSLEQLKGCGDSEVRHFISCRYDL